MRTVTVAGGTHEKDASSTIEPQLRVQPFKMAADLNDEAFDQAALVFRAFTRNSAAEKTELAALRQKFRTVVAALEATSDRLRDYENVSRRHDDHHPLPLSASSSSSVEANAAAAADDVNGITTHNEDNQENREESEEQPSDKPEEDDNDVDCVLCFETVRDDEEHAQVPLCRHLFHATCFKKCVRDVDRCPICRCPIGSLLQPKVGTKPFPQGRIGEAPATPPPSPTTPRRRSNNHVGIVRSDPFFPFGSEGVLQQVIFDAFLAGPAGVGLGSSQPQSYSAGFYPPV